MAKIIYNETVSVDSDIENQWLEWVRQTYLPECLKTGCFTGARFTKVRSHRQPGSTSYSIQFWCEEDRLLEQFKNIHEKKFRKMAREKFGAKQIPFTTELELIGDLFDPTQQA